ncbi:unnamed protein product [Echinostoma caproni]|uniref:Uncharacterized protein n=1 Tax=Echinostoma caproni TaxID=27848 RepID=A0A3P8HAF3_9TREM|nr:unnamed protein product [Echinostoma caproni]
MIHFFLTGVYVQDESPEGGRFKKLYFSHSQPQLLLIRDEAGAPDIQLASWADALVVVVSLADAESVRIASEYYTMFCGLRDKLDIPTMLIATQDALVTGPSAPAIELHVRHLLNSMNWCPYYETCAVYGLNVEPVFQEIVARVLSQRDSAPHGDNSNSDARSGRAPSCSSSCLAPNTLPMPTCLSNSEAKVFTHFAFLRFY